MWIETDYGTLLNAANIVSANKSIAQPGKTHLVMVDGSSHLIDGSKSELLTDEAAAEIIAYGKKGKRK